MNIYSPQYKTEKRPNSGYLKVQLTKPVSLQGLLMGVWVKSYLKEEKWLKNICISQGTPQYTWQLIKAENLEYTAQPKVA